MKDYIEERVMAVASYLLSSRATVREAARYFRVSKSTVHKDMTERLPRIDTDLATDVKAVLDANKAERHIRGGLATRLKYRHSDE